MIKCFSLNMLNAAKEDRTRPVDFNQLLGS